MRQWYKDTRNHESYWTDEEIERWWNRIKDKPNPVTWDAINLPALFFENRYRRGRCGKKIVAQNGETGV